MNEKLVYLNPKWQQTLNDNQLNSFEDFWQLDLPAVDEGNFGRGHAGWSRVCIHKIGTQSGQKHWMVIKRQSNYRSRTLRHPLRGIPTFIKEFNFIRRYSELNVPALKAVFCACRQQGKELQAILVTEYLSNYLSLEELLEEWDQRESQQKRTTEIECVARLIARLHQQKLEHRCLFPKHIFLPNDPLTENACLIDLEKTRYKPWGDGYRVRDLTALARRTKQVTNRDRVLFMREYFGITRLNQDAKKLWQQVKNRIYKKAK